MKNQIINYYKFSYGNFWDKTRNFIRAMGFNIGAFGQLLLIPTAVFAVIVNTVLYKISEFEYGFLIVIVLYLIVRIIVNLMYFFTKKGVYIFDNQMIVIKNGYCVQGGFYSFRGFKYTFHISQIKNIDVYGERVKLYAWEWLMYLPKNESYIMIELNDGRKFAFILENNNAFVDEINEIRESYSGE